MTKCNFYAICADTENSYFYKIEYERFGEQFLCRDKTKTLEIKHYVDKAIDIITRYPKINFRRREIDEGVTEWITHTPVAFVVEVNSHLQRPKISFDKEVRKFGSVENVGDEPTSAGESFGEFKDTQNAQNNAKIQNEALKERLIAEAREDCKRLRAIFIKIEVNTTLYFEDEKGEIKHLWFKNNEVEQYGSIKTLMIMGKAFVLVDFAASRDPLIRFCQGFQSEFLNEPKEDEE